MPRCSRQCVTQCLFQLLLWKKHFLWRWYCVVKKQIEMWFFVVCTLIDNEYASLLFSQSFFELFLHKINLRCFLKVFVNKPSHFIELRSGEDQYFIFNPKLTGQNILMPARRIQKTTNKPWSKNNRLDLCRSTPSFLHYIEERLSLSTIKQISKAKKPRYN